MVHHGGFISYRAFEEARRCYLYGQFIAVVLLCQIVLEHTLAGFFRAEGRNDLERDGFQRLLNEALQAGYISQQEYNAFDNVRSLRNPYVHYRSPEHPEHIGHRVVESNTTPLEIVEEDAQTALEAVFRFLNREPFSLRGDS